ncbi:MAG: hypothetical protein H7330_01500 [Hymenobacteraceae bacterium]|nr:hypothetical protein [Hymenobacteraceae bacterium]
MLIPRFILLSTLLSIGAIGPVRSQTITKSDKPPAVRPAPARTGRATPARAATKQLPVPAANSIKPEERAQQMTTSMTQALGLAAAQTQRVHEINLFSVKRVEEARRTYARQLPRMRAEIELIGNSRLSLLKDALTEQQFRAYAAMREKKMGIPDVLKQQAKMSEAADGQ